MYDDGWFWLKWIFDCTESKLNAFKLFDWIQIGSVTSLNHAMQAMHCRTVSAAHWDVVRCRPQLVCWVLQDVTEASTFLWGDGATDASLEPGWVSMIFMGKMRINQWMQRQIWVFPNLSEPNIFKNTLKSIEFHWHGETKTFGITSQA